MKGNEIIMKKILSALIPMLTLISILVSNNIFAFAETTKYWEPRPNCQDTIACVNDKDTAMILKCLIIMIPSSLQFHITAKV